MRREIAVRASSSGSERANRFTAETDAQRHHSGTLGRRHREGYPGRVACRLARASRMPLTAGVVQWQNGSFPSFIRGFDSLHPLHVPPTTGRGRRLAGRRSGRRHAAATDAIGVSEPAQVSWLGARSLRDERTDSSAISRRHAAGSGDVVVRALRRAGLRQPRRSRRADARSIATMRCCCRRRRRTSCTTLVHWSALSHAVLDMALVVLTPEPAAADVARLSAAGSAGGGADA